jgi:hypothetical protein
MVDPQTNRIARINHLVQHANPTKGANLPDDGGGGPSQFLPARRPGRSHDYVRHGPADLLVAERHGSFASIPLDATARIASALAPQAGLHPGCRPACTPAPPALPCAKPS